MLDQVTPTAKAHEMFYNHYMVLFDSDSDKGEEILVSMLAKKSALVSVNEILGMNIIPGDYDEIPQDRKFWEDVRVCINNIDSILE